MTANACSGRALVLIAAALAACGQLPRSGVDACALSAPPEGAIRGSAYPGGPITIAFPDPAKVAPNYTGCLNVWSETATGFVHGMQAEFSSGRIKWLRLGKGEVYCEYEGDVLTKENVASEFSSGVEKYFPKPTFDVASCPPASEMIPSKWK